MAAAKAAATTASLPRLVPEARAGVLDGGASK